MAKLTAFTLKHRGRYTLISNLRDAKVVIAYLLKRTFAGDIDLTRIAGMIDEAIAGHQVPSAAFRAFAQFAYSKGLVSRPEKSKAWDEFLKMIADL